MFHTLSRIPRTISLAVFRLHIENGLTVSIGIAAIALGFYGWAGSHAAVAAATGALINSIVDRPEPLARKPVTMARALLPACIVTFLTLLSLDYPIALLAVTALVGMTAGMLSALGKPGLSLSAATILPMAFAMSTPLPDTTDIWSHMAYFTAGAVIYAGWAMNVARLLDDRVRRLLLGEATRSFVRYLKAKANLLDPAANGPAAFRALIEAHSGMAERLQSARDAIFTRRKNAKQMHRVDALIALLDATELFLSSDADIETLRSSRHHHLLRRLRSLTFALAQDVEDVTVRLKEHDVQHDMHTHDKQEQTISAEIARLEASASPDDEQEMLALAAFRTTFNKIRRAEAALARFASTLDGDSPVSKTASEVDLTAFTQGVGGWSAIAAQTKLSAPALRYAFRLSAAMTTGLALTMLFGNFSHGSWVVVTTALIMRANYSLTSQRRWDRVTGTLIGCTLAAILSHFASPAWTAPIIVGSIGISHAYALVNYRVTAIFASVNALLLLHMLEPQSGPVFLERILDTFLGAGLSYLFSFMLPTWERRNLTPGVARLIVDMQSYVGEALTRTPVDLSYRLARKRVLDAITALSDTVRRVADEPHTDEPLLVRLYELLAASYLLVSDIASVHVITHVRRAELDERADELLSDVKNTVILTLKGEFSEGADNDARLRRRGFSALDARNSLTVLRRRLIHVERMALRVGRLSTGTIDNTAR